MTKHKQHTYIISVLALIYIGFINIACGEDRREEYHEQTKVDRWIEKTMNQHYYWDIPSADKQRNYFSPPKEFFKSLLSDNEKKNGRYYSYIESIASAKTRSIKNISNSYGFEFVYVPDLFKDAETQSNQMGVLVLYTVKNSPAREAGLKRGDWIIGMNGHYITEKDIDTFLSGGASQELQLGTYQEGKDYNSGKWIFSKEIHLPGARAIEDNPVHTTKILNVEGKKVGYILYNHFTTGKDKNMGDTSYDDAIRNVSKEFKKAGVDDVVLDLRYNNGGIISSAALFCEILAPASCQGETMYFLKFNRNHKDPWVEQTFDKKFLGDGANLDLKDLYILTSNWTASASELIINSLSPYMNVVLIGAKTEGKNLGSNEFTDDEDLWTMHPIVCQIYNKDKESEYAKGFDPHFSSGEIGELYRLEELGNPDEVLLKIALAQITGTQPAVKESSKTRTLKDLQFLSPSLNRKSTPVCLHQ